MCNCTKSTLCQTSFWTWSSCPLREHLLGHFQVSRHPILHGGIEKLLIGRIVELDAIASHHNPIAKTVHQRLKIQTKTIWMYLAWRVVLAIGRVAATSRFAVQLVFHSLDADASRALIAHLGPVSWCTSFHRESAIHMICTFCTIRVGHLDKVGWVGLKQYHHSLVSFCFCFLLLSSILHPSFAMSCPRLKKKTNKLKRERERGSERENMQRAKMAKGCTKFQSISMQAKLILIHCSRWIKCNNLPPFAWHLMILGHVWTWWMTMCLLSLGFWSPKNCQNWFPRVSPYDLRLEKSTCMGQLCSLQQGVDGLLLPLVPSLLCLFFKQTLKIRWFRPNKNCPDGSDFTLNPLKQFFNWKQRCSSNWS